MAEEWGEFFHLVYRLELGSGVAVEPRKAQQQSLRRAEARVVDALVHTAVAVESLGLALYDIAGEIEPLRERLHGCLHLRLHAGQLVCQSKAENTSHTHA